MELNYNCIRDVMKYLEKHPSYVLNDDNQVEHHPISLATICENLPNYPKDVVFYVITRLDEAGFLSVSSQWAGDCVYLCYVNYITYAGHEFLEKIKDDTVWKKTLGFAGTVGNFSLKMIGEISEAVATAYFKQLLGVN